MLGGQQSVGMYSPLWGHHSAGNDNIAKQIQKLLTARCINVTSGKPVMGSSVIFMEQEDNALSH